MVIILNSKIEFFPCCGQGTDHNVEGIVIGIRDMGEEGGSIIEIFDINEPLEEEIGVLNGVDNHLCMNFPE